MNIPPLKLIAPEEEAISALADWPAAYSGIANVNKPAANPAGYTALLSLLIYLKEPDPGSFYVLTETQQITVRILHQKLSLANRCLSDSIMIVLQRSE